MAKKILIPESKLPSTYQLPKKENMPEIKKEVKAKDVTVNLIGENKEKGYKFYSQADLKEKTCNQCGKTLPITSFWKDKYMKSGFSSYCKECYNKRWGTKKDKNFVGKGQKYSNQCR